MNYKVYAALFAASAIALAACGEKKPSEPAAEVATEQQEAAPTTEPMAPTEPAAEAITEAPPAADAIVSEPAPVAEPAVEAEPAVDEAAK